VIHSATDFVSEAFFQHADKAPLIKHLEKFIAEGALWESNLHSKGESLTHSRFSDMIPAE
jgi:hypothetical protein